MPTVKKNQPKQYIIGSKDEQVPQNTPLPQIPIEFSYGIDELQAGFDLCRITTPGLRPEIKQLHP